MKKIKTILAMLIVAALLFSLASCSGGTESTALILSGKTFVLPAAGSDFLDQGFSIPEEYSEFTFKPHYDSVIDDLYLTDASGNAVQVNTVINDQDEEKGFGDCTINSITLSAEKIKDKKSFSLPGGITLDSTYDDVIKAYGEGKNNPNFESSTFDVVDSFDLSGTLSYNYQKGTNYCYSFLFNEEDKTIMFVQIFVV